MKKLFYIVLFLSSVISAQRSFPSVVFFEHYILRGDDSSSFYLFYNIPNNNLVFQKTETAYTSSYSLFIEITDSLGNIIARDTKQESLEVNSFERTNSLTESHQSMMIIKLKPGSYIANLYFKNLTSNNDIILKPFKIEKTEFDNDIFTPLIVNSVKEANSNLFELINSEGNIPYSENEYQLLVPVINKNKDSALVLMQNNTDTIFNKMFEKSFTGDLNFVKKENKIFVSTLGESKYSFFVLDGFSKKLREGSLLIAIDKDYKTQKAVKWYNKPISLSDEEFAIRQLKNLVSIDSVEALLDNEPENYKNILFNFWKPFDRTKVSAFNPTMEEFYKRVDYTLRSFSSMTQKNGAESDRGKVYIKYGKPEKNERTFDGNGFVIEVWEYEKLKLKFFFRDEKGTGEFKLIDE